MNNQEIKEAIQSLSQMLMNLENTYEENGGEVTEATEEMENQIAVFQSLLEGEGIDSLGRWLKSKEDERDAYKAEKKAAELRIKACENSIEYIKFQIGQVLRAIGQKEAKGTFYKFAQSISTTTKTDTELLNKTYGETIEQAIRKAGVPNYVSVSLKASVSALPEGEELPAFFVRTSEDTIRFTKPRKVKEA